MSMVDWSTLAATTIAAASFIWGIISWRASYLGQKKIELAEQVYELSLNCADHIRAIRSPAGYIGEGSTRPRSTNESEEQRVILDNAYVALERIEARKDDFNKLFSLVPRFEFYFNENSTKHVMEISHILQEIRISSIKLSRYWINQGRDFINNEDFEKHLKKMNDAEEIFWDSFDINDPINHRLDKSISHIKDICKRSVNPNVNIWIILKKILYNIDQFFRIPPNIRDM